MKKNNNKKIANVNSIYVDVNFRFGNLIAFVNKLIYYCEIIHCKYIIFNENKFWFFNKSINVTFRNITFRVGNISDYNNSCVLDGKPWTIYKDFFNIKPEIKIHYFRNEILSNLPKVKISKNDLFIHIRSGNVFKSYIHSYYSQPPFCFYENILKKFNYTKIFLIAQNAYNPVVNKLIKKFPSILYTESSIKKDISLLINAYRIVCSISSFLAAILQLNNNIEYLWDFNIYRNEEKLRHFHYDFNDLPHNNFSIFRMEPSNIYRMKMYEWKNSKSQIKLMFKDKCNNDFIIIKKF